MARKSLNSWIVTLILFVGMASLTMGAGYYKKSVANESASFKVNLPTAKKSAEVILNLTDQGFAKKLFQPNKFTISSGHGSGVTNKGKEPIELKVQTQGFVGIITLDSADPYFNPESGVFSRPLMPNQSIKVKVNFDIPKELIKQAKICEGSINFINNKDGSIIATVPVRVINSKYTDSTGTGVSGEDCCK